jgi:hypothetical protein
VDVKNFIAATKPSWRLASCITFFDEGNSMKNQNIGSNAQVSEVHESVVLRLDELEISGRHSVVYEIARIDALLGFVFLQDLNCHLVNCASL